MKVVRFLRSAKLAAWCLALLGALAVLAFVIPQRTILGDPEYLAWHKAHPLVGGLTEALGFESVFTSIPFMALAAVLMANLTLCTAHRLRRRSYRSLSRLTPPEHATPLGAAASEEAIAQWVDATGWQWSVRTPATGSGWLLERGRWGVSGSVILHVGLILLGVAGLVSAFTRFSGTMVIAEGQTVLDQPASYLAVSQAPRLGSAFGNFTVGLDSMEMVYDGERVTEAVAHMRAIEGDKTRQAAVRTNFPLKVQGKSFLLEKSGYTVLVRAIDPTGETFEANVNLASAVSEGYSDGLEIRGKRTELLAVPDRSRADQPASKRLLLVDPAVRVTIDGQSAWLRPGESAQVGPMLVAIQDIGLWTTFLVRSDRGLPIAYVAFAAIILGMLIRWLDPDGLLAVAPTPDDTNWVVWWRDRQGSRSAQGLAEDLKSWLVGKEAE